MNIKLLLFVTESATDGARETKPLVALHSAIWFEAFRQSRLLFVAVPSVFSTTFEPKVAAPADVIFQLEPVIEVLSNADPMVMVSAVVLFVPMFIILPWVPVPIFIVFALLPVPRLTVPVVPESSVRLPVPFESKEMALLVLEGETTGLLPEKVSAVAVNVLVLIVPSTVKLPLA
jgi:hypothetical protein